MSNDSSKQTAKNEEQKAESASSTASPVPPSSSVAVTSVRESATDDSPQPSGAALPGSKLPAPDSNRVPYGPWLAVFYAIFVFFAAQFIAGYVLILFAKLQGWDANAISNWISSSVRAQFFYVLLAEALTFSAITWFMRKKGSSLRALGWRRLAPKDVLYALIGFAAYFGIYAVLLAIVTQLIPSINLNQSQDIGFSDVTSQGSLILTFISLVVLPPIVEEVVFRGFVFGGLKTKLPVIWAAVGTSLLFASAHLQFGNGKPLLWVAAIDTFTLSMVLCYLRQRTGKLGAGILVHALKNGVAFVTLFILQIH